MIPTWWRKLINLASGKTRKARRGRQPAVKPRLFCLASIERLEDRIVPTAMYLSTGLVVNRGAIAQVAVNTDTLNDPANGNEGLCGADIDVFYDQSIFTVSSSSITLGTIATNGSTAPGEGYSPTALNGWSTGPNNTSVPGEIQVALSTNSKLITDSASGSLVLINFQVKSNAALGLTHINLAADIFGNGGTNMADANFNGYTLNPPPQDNVTSLSPYTYIGTASTDQDDSAITIAGTTPPPVAGNDAYSVTARSTTNTANLSVGANAVQTLTFSGGSTQGVFQLAFESQTTGQLSYSTVPSTLQSTIQTALANLSSIGAGNVAVSAASSTMVTVTFQAGLGGLPQPNMTVDPTVAHGGNNPLVTVATTTNGDAGALVNAFSPIGDPIFAIQESSPADGTLSFNANGSFTYTPNFNFVGADSFTFVADDPTLVGSAGYSSTATVTVNVTARLSIPTNLTGVPGGTVVVPVNMDDPDPAGSGGVVGVAIAIDYNPSFLTINSSGINFGTLTSNTNTVQTITFEGTVTGGSFFLAYGGSTTGSITYSTSAAALQSSIQAALDSLATVSTGNSVVSAVSATDVTVTFQGALAAKSIAAMTDNSSLQGTNPTLAVAVTTTGFPAWGSAPVYTIGTGAYLGQLAVTVSSGAPNINTVGGSLVLLTFSVNATAPGGPTPIYLMASNDPLGNLSVVTRLDGVKGQIALSPAPINGNVPGVDGLVTIAAPHFNVVVPASTTAGTPLALTVTAENANGTTNTAYNGTVAFSSTDPSAKLPLNSTLVNGVGTFTATLNTVGSQTITAADTVNSALSNASGPIEVNAQGAHFVISASGDDCHQQRFLGHGKLREWQRGRGARLQRSRAIHQHRPPGHVARQHDAGQWRRHLEYGVRDDSHTNADGYRYRNRFRHRQRHGRRHRRVSCAIQDRGGSCQHHGGPAVYHYRHCPGFRRQYGGNLYWDRAFFVERFRHRGSGAGGLHVYRGRPRRACVYQRSGVCHRRKSKHYRR